MILNVLLLLLLLLFIILWFSTLCQICVTCEKKEKQFGPHFEHSLCLMIVAKVVRTLGIFKRFQNSCRNIAGTTCDGKNLLESWNWWTGLLKVRTSTPSSKFGASRKINWTALSYIERKAVGLSCRRHGITLVLKFSGKILTLCQRDVLMSLLKRWTHQILKTARLTSSDICCAPSNHLHVSWTL